MQSVLMQIECLLCHLPKLRIFDLLLSTLAKIQLIICSYHNPQERDGPQKTKSQTSHREPRPTGTRRVPLCGQG